MDATRQTRFRSLSSPAVMSHASSERHTPKEEGKCADVKMKQFAAHTPLAAASGTSTSSAAGAASQMGTAAAFGQTSKSTASRHPRTALCKEITGIRLMAEYSAPPLWHDTDHLVGPIKPSELGLSKRLQKDLAIWNHRYTSRLNWDSPSQSRGWKSDGERVRFMRQRDELAHRLRTELPGVKVVAPDVY